jgi:hypothetical protein
MILVGMAFLFCFLNTNILEKSSLEQTANVESDKTTNVYFNNGEAIFLRHTFNNYLAGKVSNISRTVLEGTGSEYTGLNSFKGDYYRSPFIVYEENNTLAGGKQLEIIFVNKPDKMFTA